MMQSAVRSGATHDRGSMFVRRPEFLVFDALSGALDIETQQHLLERILAEGDVACLAIPHRKAALHRADQIVLLDAGCC